jgi:16S rRNA G966 N2-methylase RsmD
MNLETINKIFPISPNNNLLKYDEEGLWSISLPNDATEISLFIYEITGFNITIFDGTAGIGGNVISFSKYFKNVVAVELDIDRFNILKNNIDIFKITNVELINGDCNNYLNDNFNVYFFDPPWGGKEYKSKEKIKLKLGDYTLNNIIKKINDIIIKNNNKIIVFKLPYNYDLSEFNNYDYNIIKIKNYILIKISININER